VTQITSSPAAAWHSQSFVYSDFGPLPLVGQRASFAPLNVDFSSGQAQNVGHTEEAARCPRRFSLTRSTRMVVSIRSAPVALRLRPQPKGRATEHLGIDARLRSDSALPDKPRPDHPSLSVTYITYSQPYPVQPYAGSRLACAQSVSNGSRAGPWPPASPVESSRL
jgi:hypothetical protein